MLRILSTAAACLLLAGSAVAQSANSGSAYLPSRALMRASDASPVNPEADPNAYVFTGTSFTMEAWVFPMVLPSHKDADKIVIRPIHQDPWEAYALSIANWSAEDNPIYEFELGSGTDENGMPMGATVHGPAAVVGTWTHLAGVYDGTTARFYVNGSLVGETPYTEPLLAGEDGFYVGARPFHRFFHGLIDEVRIWDVARTQAQIQASMNATLTGMETGLRGYWALDGTVDVNGTTAAPDGTSHHNDLAVWGVSFLDLPAGSEVKIAPGVVPGHAATVVGEALAYQPRVTGWPLPALSIAEAPAGVSVVDGEVRWTPAAGQHGRHTIVIEASNDVGAARDTLEVWVDLVGAQAANHDTGRLAASALNNGAVGRGNVSGQGVGLVYGGENGLFDGTLLVGRSSSQVSGALFRREFGTEGAVTAIPSYLGGSLNTAYEARYHDGRAPDPIGVEVIQRSFSVETGAGVNDGFVVLEYEVVNPGQTDLDGIHLGLAMDFDVGNGGANVAGYSEAERLMYMHEAGGATNPYYYGIAALSHDLSGRTAWVNGSTGYGDADYWNQLTTFASLPADTSDLRVSIGSGPFTIPAGGSVRTRFALVAGPDLAALQAQTTAARDLAGTILVLAAPVLSGPADGGAASPGAVTLGWGSVDGATAYEVQLARDASFESPVVSTTAAGQSYAASDLDEGRYYWRVRAVSPERPGPWSEPHSFVVHAAQVARQASVSFGGAETTSQFRLVSLPGAGEVPVANTLTGTSGTDWNAYAQGGAAPSFLKAYDGSAAFAFRPGRAFWVISKNAWEVSGDAAAVTLDAEGRYGVTLEPGWNLVASPFDVEVPWSSVQAANPAVTQPIWSFEGDWSQAAAMRPYAGYYLYNGGEQTTLVLPYPVQAAGKNASGRQDAAFEGLLRLTAESAEGRASAAVALHAGAAAGPDDLDILAPPATFAPVALTLQAASDDAGSRVLAREVRPSIGEGQTFELELTAAPGTPVTLRADGADAFGPHRVLLVDERQGRRLELTAAREVSIIPSEKVTALRLLVGSPAYLQGAELPDRVTLRENYPNPFNPETTLEYGLPEAGPVRLEIYDVLGRRVRTLFAGEQSAGWHRAAWDGRDDAGRAAASGVYLGRLVTGRATHTVTMSLVK